VALINYVSICKTAFEEIISLYLYIICVTDLEKDIVVFASWF